MRAVGGAGPRCAALGQRDDVSHLPIPRAVVVAGAPPVAPSGQPQRSSQGKLALPSREGHSDPNAPENAPISGQLATNCARLPPDCSTVVGGRGTVPVRLGVPPSPPHRPPSATPTTSGPPTRGPWISWATSGRFPTGSHLIWDCDSTRTLSPVRLILCRASKRPAISTLHFNRLSDYPKNPTSD